MNSCRNKCVPSMDRLGKSHLVNCSASWYRSRKKKGNNSQRVDSTAVFPQGVREESIVYLKRRKKTSGDSVLLWVSKMEIEVANVRLRVDATSRCLKSFFIFVTLKMKIV
ncbi:hypothetical protein TNCV_3843841 [Trichonephila clavipes]|nr:hypothetical protein TNCV_3843841 [Trichonephila clavipes]